MNLFYDWHLLPENRYILHQKVKGYYHISSHGLEKNVIFKKKEDFIAGMNDIAICVLGFDVIILCFMVLCQSAGGSLRNIKGDAQ